MSPNGAAERVAADALDRFWDSLATAHAQGAPGGPARPDELLDPDLKRSVRQLKMIDATPHPEPGFAGQLWADLMAGQNPPVAQGLSLGDGQPAPAVTGRWRVLPRHRFLTELAIAAALLIVVLGGGAVLELPVALDPAAPTAAASAGAAETSRMAVSTTCAGLVTPEPTRIALQRLAAPVATNAPTALAPRTEPC